MGLTAMLVGGTMGFGSKAAVNTLMKVSLRRGEREKLGKRSNLLD